MPVKLSSMSSTAKKVEITFGDDVLTVMYNQARYTPKLEREMAAYVESDQPGALLVAMLSEVVTGWDAVQEDGETALPLNRETLEGMPIEALSKILAALGSANSVDPPSTKALSDSF